MLLSSLGTSVANVALPTLEEAFDASFAQVQWVVLAYLLAVTTLVVSAGRLGDLVGRRRLLIVGIAAFVGASALCALAPSLALLVAARAVQGTGAAIMMALTLAFVAEAAPKARTGSAMGLLGTTSAIGTALGPSIGGLLIAGLGWRAIFLANVPIGLLALGIAHRHLPPDRRRAEPGRPRFDVVGTLLLALTLAAYALAMTIEHGRVMLLAGAVVGVVLFVVVETRTRAPLVRASMLRERGLRAGLATSALVSTVMMATLVVGPFYLARVLGLDPALLGLAMSVGPAVVILAGVPAGRIADRVGTGRLGAVGLTTMVLGALCLSVAPARLGLPGYLARIVVVTLGYALFQTANNTAVMAGARPDQRGVISGMLNLSRNLGLVTGASVMGTVFALGAGTASLASAPPEAVATGMHVVFAVAAVLLVAALVMAAGGLRRLPGGRAAAPSRSG
jgi:EmrB/QacA subfamily drug resistance transporter